MRCFESVIGLILIACLTSCTGIELAEENPLNLKLSGTWVLDVEASDASPDLKHGLRERRTRQRASRDQRDMQQHEIRGALGSGLAFIVHDFQVLNADEIEIELNHDSMGIRYEPGVYRDVSWGKRERPLWEVHAGWEEDQLVIISTADRMQVIERHQRRGDELWVNVVITADREERTLQRVFKREH